MKFWVVIPARLNSTRLPRKPLLDICGKPMIVRVIDVAKLSGAEKIIVATDNTEIFKIAESHGAQSFMTDTNHPSGSDRILEAVKKNKAHDEQILVNLQGDEPLMPHDLVRGVAKLKYDHPRLSVTTVVTPLTKNSLIDDENCVKVVLNRLDEAIYFSRSPIPYSRNEQYSKLENLKSKNLRTETNYFRHLGLYSFKVCDLESFVKWGPCSLEKTEKLEQLRWLWNKRTIKVMINSSEPPHGVDTPDDLERVRNLFSKTL